MWKLNEKQISRLAKEKAQHETKLLLKLEKVFSDYGPFLETLRKFVAQGVEHMAVLAQRDWNKVKDPAEQIRVHLEFYIINAVIEGEAPLAIWKRHGNPHGATVPGLVYLVRKWNKWSIEDCGSLIRLYGKFIKAMTMKYKTFKRMKEYKYFEKVINERNLDIPEKSDMIGNDVKKQQKKTRPYKDDVWKDDKRARIESKNAKSKTLKKMPISVQAGRMEALRILKLANPDRTRYYSMGMNRWRFRSQSTVLKVDTIFGLPGGGDISGTTAETTFFHSHIQKYFFEVFSGPTYGGLNSVLNSQQKYLIRMLPLASIAAQGHHSLLEVALALTIESESRIGESERSGITYTIGKYSSLMPIPILSVRNKLIDEIYWLLKGAEFNGNNHRMLCWYENRHLAGYIFGRSGKEKLYFEKIARTGKTFMTIIAGFPQRLKKRHVGQLAANQGVKWPPPFTEEKYT